MNEEQQEYEPTMNLRFRREWVSDERVARILQQQWIRPNELGGVDEWWRDVQTDDKA